MAPNPTTVNYSALVADEPNQMVQVAAPATLPEGYHFEASFEGNVFTVAVPAGGVTEGQLLTVPYSSTGLLHPTFRSEADAFFATSEIPMGRWRDGLCDCFRSVSKLHSGLIILKSSRFYVSSLTSAPNFHFELGLALFTLRSSVLGACRNYLMLKS